MLPNPGRWRSHSHPRQFPVPRNPPSPACFPKSPSQSLSAGLSPLVLPALLMKRLLHPSSSWKFFLCFPQPSHFWTSQPVVFLALSCALARHHYNFLGIFFQLTKIVWCSFCCIHGVISWMLGCGCPWDSDRNLYPPHYETQGRKKKVLEEPLFFQDC